MVKFEFVVDDVDAETIFYAMNSLLANVMLTKIKSTTIGDIFTAAWCDKHIQYLNELKNKMTNCRVEENK